MARRGARHTGVLGRKRQRQERSKGFQAGQEKAWASKAGAVRTISVADLPADSKLLG